MLNQLSSIFEQTLDSSGGKIIKKKNENKKNRYKVAISHTFQNKYMSLEIVL